MRSRLAVLFAVVLVCFAASPALAQEAVLSGQVTHEDGAPVANATVSIPDLGLSATTGPDGRYTLTVPPGSVSGQTVEVRVVAPGLQSRTANVDARRRSPHAGLLPGVLLPAGGDRRVPRHRHRGGESGSGGHHPGGTDRERVGKRRDGPDHRGHRAVVQLPAADDRGRNGLRASRHPAQPRTGPRSRAHQRQAPTLERPRLRQRHDRPRRAERRPERDPVGRDREDRGAP